jgi:uncharacterized protein involved in exopolysaccharide biosynthesis
MVMTRSQIKQLRMAPRRVAPNSHISGAVGWGSNLLAKFLRFTGLGRSKANDLTIERVLRGGRLSDLGRFRRYGLISFAGLAFCWLPAVSYIKYGAIQYTSHFALILPGAGSSSSMNIADIGQASSAANSAFSSSTISPTVTYKNLIMSANVLNAAAQKLGIQPEKLSVPAVKLVDETSFIDVEMTGPTSMQARDRAKAIQDAFFIELDKLRDDEITRRENSTSATVKQYEAEVDAIRFKIKNLQTESGLHSIEQYNTLVATTDQLKSRIADTESSLARADMMASSLAESLGISPAFAALTMKLHADPEFAALTDATAKVEAEFAQTEQQFGSNHPKVIEARTRFAGVRVQMIKRAKVITGLPEKSLSGSIDFSPIGQRTSLFIQLVNSETEKQGLTGQLAQMKSQLVANLDEIKSLAETSAKMDKLDRQHKLAEAVFTSALGRITTSKSDIFASYPMVQVTEAAVMPLTPSAPNKKIAIGSAIGSTLLLLIGALLGWVRRPLIDKLLKKAAPLHEQANAA